MPDPAANTWGAGALGDGVAEHLADLPGVFRLVGGPAGDLGDLLGSVTGPAGVRNALVEMLGDPSLELVYRVSDRETHVYVNGPAVALPAAGSGRKRSNRAERPAGGRDNDRL